MAACHATLEIVLPLQNLDHYLKHIGIWPGAFHPTGTVPGTGLLTGSQRRCSALELDVPSWQCWAVAL